MEQPLYETSSKNGVHREFTAKVSKSLPSEPLTKTTAKCVF
jgi:hypothetical protein